MCSANTKRKRGSAINIKKCVTQNFKEKGYKSKNRLSLSILKYKSKIKSKKIRNGNYYGTLLLVGD